MGLVEHGLAGVLKHLLEFAGVRLPLPIFGISNHLRLDNAHQTLPMQIAGLGRKGPDDPKPHVADRNRVCVSRQFLVETG